MKMKLLSCVLILLLGVPLMAAPPQGRPAVHTAPLNVSNTTRIDVNRILMFVTNHGNFGRDLSGVFGNDYGTYYPYAGDGSILDGSNTRSPYYAGGLWIGGVDTATGDTLVCISEYSSEYVPGPMSGDSFFVDNPRFKVYKLYRDSMAANPNDDYKNWPVDQGAPVDSLGLPKLVGDQMCWAVFNDADSAQHVVGPSAGKTAPIGLEVRQTVFGFDRQGTLGDMVFIKQQVFNRGNRTLENCYISLWSDPDLGQAGDDLVGCDTLLDLGFCYNEGETDQKYDPLPPPCLGIDFFQGPLVHTGDMADTGLMWDTIWPGYYNMGLYSFNKYINGTDPDGFAQTYMFMEGLNAKQGGTPYTYLGDTLTYVCSGDPVTDEGDLDFSGDDRRMMQTTGPITLRPGDSVEIISALMVGLGGNRLNSVTVMKLLDDYAQKLYDNGKKPGKKSFDPAKAPAKPIVTVAALDNRIDLSWTDTSEFDQGDYRFEGYTVWQGASPSGPWTELATYDLVNERVGSLVDTFLNVYAGTKFPQAMRRIGNTGPDYSYIATVDAINGGPLRNLTTYYFRVTAFAYAYQLIDTTAFAAIDTLGDTLYLANDTVFTYVSIRGDTVPAGDRFIEDGDLLTIIPQSAIAGMDVSAPPGDTLEATHDGPSDGLVYPIVADPRHLTGHTYQVVFEENNPVGVDSGIPLGVAWHLIDVTTGDTLLVDQINQTGNTDYFTVDGIYLEVNGPALVGKAYTYAGADPPNLSPVAVDEQEYEGGRWITGGGPSNGGELMYGGMFMEPNFAGTDLGPSDIPTVELRFRPMESYTDLNGDSTYTIGEPYLVDDTTQTQYAFMYNPRNAGGYQGFFRVPFTAWDVSDPENPRQLNVVVRDRDGNHQWDFNFLADTEANPEDTLLPIGGDLQYNYVYITTSTYDPTGTYYGDGTSSISFFDGVNGTVDGAWSIWAYDRDNGGMLAEECTITMYPPTLNRAVDSYTFTAVAPGYTSTEADLDAIKAVPNPYYLFGPYDPAVGNSQIYFSHLPEKCTITIYNLAGDYINKVEKDDPSTSNAYWNVRTENNLPVASGIYIWVVDAPGFGQKVGKMAVFTEQQVLDIY